MKSLWKGCAGFVLENLVVCAFGFLIFMMACPFIGLYFHDAFGICMMKFHTLGLSLEQFMSLWMQFWGFVGLGLTVWLMLRRVLAMEKQQKNQEKQLETQQKQLLVTRFSESVELLGHGNQSARIGGIYSLYYLARDHEDYRETICEILCAHVRTVTRAKKYQEKYKESPANEIQTILNLLFKEQKGDLIFEDFEKNLSATFISGILLFCASLNNVNFSEATLSKVSFSKTILSNVNFSEATLSNIYFHDTKFSGVHFIIATLRSVNYRGAKLHDVGFSGATLSKVDFSGATLSYVRFDMAALSNVYYHDAKLYEVDFHGAELNEDVGLTETVLEGYDHTEITRPGRSLELTKPKEAQDSAVAAT